MYVSYKEKIRTRGILNGFPTGSNLELRVIVGENPTTIMYTYINHHAQTLSIECRLFIFL